MTQRHRHVGTAHRHDHADPPGGEAPPAPDGSPILDIGGDVGAVVVRLPAATPSGELMACRRGDPVDHFHTGVHRRAGGPAAGWVAVFPEVVAGRYSLLDGAGAEHSPFEVIGGRVTTIDLAASPA